MMGRIGSTADSVADVVAVRPASRRACGGFTMVEVALSLAIIGFALVAIIGILPAGLNVQKENREETIINQEATLWMDAIRQGAEGMDFLTNYVDAIRIVSQEFDTNGTPLGGVEEEWATPYASSLGNDFILVNGFRVVGLLSTPKYEDLGDGTVRVNDVVAYVRAVSGAASEKAPQDNQIVRESAFGYRLTCEVVPFYTHSGPWIDYIDFVAHTSGTNGATSRLLSRHAHEVALRFQWPLRPPYDFTGQGVPQFPTRLGNGRLSFRQMINGGVHHRLDPWTGDTNYGLVFFETGRFVNRGNQP